MSTSSVRRWLVRRIAPAVVVLAGFGVVLTANPANAAAMEPGDCQDFRIGSNAGCYANKTVTWKDNIRVTGVLGIKPAGKASSSDRLRIKVLRDTYVIYDKFWDYNDRNSDGSFQVGVNIDRPWFWFIAPNVGTSYQLRVEYYPDDSGYTSSAVEGRIRVRP